MSKFKNLFIAVLVTLCLTSGLAAPVSALDVSTEISHFYFSINGSTFKSSGNYISGAMISGNPTDTGNTTVTSYAILVPFTAPCQSLTLTVGMWTGILNSVGSYTADWGVIKGGKYTASGSVPVEYFSGSQEVYSYALDSSSTNSYRINRYYTFDLSGVDATGGANCFVRLSYSNADFPLRTHLKALNGLVYHGTATFKSTTAQLPTYTSSTSGNTFVAKATSGLSGTIALPNLHTWQESDDLAPVTLSAMRNSDDAEAVAELIKANATLTNINSGVSSIKSNVSKIRTTLTDMASNLQTITDDFKAREDAGNEIGGTATDKDISAGTSGLSSGSSSISSGISGLPSFSDVMAPATNYISFLTVPVQLMFGFGNGYLLYIATAMVILSVIFFIIRKMGGGSGD